MRYLLLIALAVMTISTTSFARSKNVYGEVLVTNISPADNALWKREKTAPLIIRWSWHVKDFKAAPCYLLIFQNLVKLRI